MGKEIANASALINQWPNIVIRTPLNLVLSLQIS